MLLKAWIASSWRPMYCNTANFLSYPQGERGFNLITFEVSVISHMLAQRAKTLNIPHLRHSTRRSMHPLLRVRCFV